MAACDILLMHHFTPHRTGGPNVETPIATRWSLDLRFQARPCSFRNRTGLGGAGRRPPKPPPNHRRIAMRLSHSHPTPRFRFRFRALAAHWDPDGAAVLAGVCGAVGGRGEGAARLCGVVQVNRRRPPSRTPRSPHAHMHPCVTHEPPTAMPGACNCCRRWKSDLETSKGERWHRVAGDVGGSAGGVSLGDPDFGAQVK